MAGPSNAFSEPLRVDPSIALDPGRIRLPVDPPGPVHGAQYVVEIAGPHSIPAARAYELLGPEWYPALGEPKVFVMAPADQVWRPMSTSDGAESYDSLALAWDLLGHHGNLSPASARHLQSVAEQFAQSHGRRAFPFPDPAKLEDLIPALLEARDAFDIGVEVILQGPGSTAERDLWTVAVALGFDLAPDGTFVWRVPGWELPVLILAPYEEGRAFSLRGVQAGETHEALSLGFNVPTSPDPEAALEALFLAGSAFGVRLGMAMLDDEGRAVDARRQAEMRSNLAQARSSMEASEIKPGSAMARIVFG